MLSRDKSSSRARRRLFTPLGTGAVVLFVIFFRGARCESSDLIPRFRRRSLNGEEINGVFMCWVGGEGSCEGAGESMDCRARHVE